MGSFFEDRFGEVMPRRCASRSHVVRAAELGKCVGGVSSTIDVRQDFCRGCGDIRGTRWCADLIANDLQLFAFCSKAQNRQKKISSASCINPSGPEYQVTGSRVADGLLSSELGFSVDVDWIRGVRLFIGRLLRAVEDIVGRILHQRCTALRRFLVQYRWSFFLDRVVVVWAC